MDAVSSAILARRSASCALSAAMMASRSAISFLSSWWDISIRGGSDEMQGVIQLMIDNSTFLDVLYSGIFGGVLNFHFVQIIRFGKKVKQC